MIQEKELELKRAQLPITKRSLSVAAGKHLTRNNFE